MQTFPEHPEAQLIVEACRVANIKHIVISPGSRNAPLILGFHQHPDFQVYIITDERSAAFMALGMAQQAQHPCALVCTSGTAVLNYYPAIAEAFYSQIPLLVFSADRPKHLIDIGEGQTIRQFEVFKNHTLASMDLDLEEDATLENFQKTIEKSIIEKGPVHINAPFDEPLYGTTTTLEVPKLAIKKTLEKRISSKKIREQLAQKWNTAKRKIILVGTHTKDLNLEEILGMFSRDPSVLIIVENTANCTSEKFISGIDKLIFSSSSEVLQQFKPDVLLTLGGMVVSKKIKQFFRNYKPQEHWHLGTKKLDTYFSLTEHLNYATIDFLQAFYPETKENKSDFGNFWKAQRKLKEIKHTDYLAQCEYSDLKAFEKVLSQIPKASILQLGNSATIRYAQLFEMDASISVFCNRGTAGIEGSTSTAVGSAIINGDKTTTLILGDLSFFYDSNALWNAYVPPTFRIIVINNGGGGIFRFIEGPSKSDALPFFEAPHNVSAAHLCKMHQLEYTEANDLESLEAQLNDFYAPSSKPKLLEVFTPKLRNAEVLKNYFSRLSN